MQVVNLEALMKETKSVIMERTQKVVEVEALVMKIVVVIINDTRKYTYMRMVPRGEIRGHHPLGLLFTESSEKVWSSLHQEVNSMAVKRTTKPNSTGRNGPYD
jgi:hypothetical protein